MKKLLRITLMSAIVLSAMLLMCITSSALTDGDWEFQLLDNEAQITKYLGTDTNIIIPETLYGVPVTEVANSCDMWKAESVIYPSNVKVIYQNHGEALKSVHLPEGLEKIEMRAFRDCKNLTTINIPNSVTYIGWEAFLNCTSLKQVHIPDNAELERYSFQNSGLTSVDMTGKHLKMGSGVFCGCKDLKSIAFSEFTTELPMETCSGCISLEKVLLPNSIKTINKYSFSDCMALKQLVLPTSLKVFWGGGPMGLEELVIPYGVEEVNGPNGFPFIRDSNIRAIYLPDTVKRLNGTIVENCPNAIVYCSADSFAAKDCKSKKISYLTDSSVNTGIHVYYNGTRVSFHAYGQNPELLNSRTLVPLRSIFEAMGAEVEWDTATSTAIAKRGKVEVKIQIGASTMQKNGASVALDVPAQLLNDRTMVPVRVIAEAFGASVEWNGNGNAVIINE